VIQTVQLTYARWLQEVDRVAIFDPRKLFDTHGNPIDIPALGDDEAAVIAGFEICEEFSGKGANRVPVGYTRKFKLVDKLKALELAGKARKFMEQDDGESDESKLKKSIQVVFVSVNDSGGNGHANGDTAVNAPTRKVTFVPAQGPPRRLRG
jgi:hypothetical protein